MIHVHLDFETYCDLDLKQVGVHRYVMHPSFRVLCMAWRSEHEPRPIRAVGAELPVVLANLVQHPGVRLHAWNAMFEAVVLELHYRQRPVNPISCTMQRALAYGLPARLSEAVKALGVAAQKDMTGHRLMLKMTKPLKPGAAPWTVNDRLALAAYCAADVDAEMAVSAAIPLLQPQEERLSQVDKAMNDGGMPVDIDRVRVLMAAARAAEPEDMARAAALTDGLLNSVGTQTARLLGWLRGEGLDGEDVGRATLIRALEGPLSARVREVLEIRLRLAKASTKKLERMLAVGGWDGMLRGQFQFCGAGRTGRWSGRLVQVQNLPRRRKDFDVEGFAKACRSDPGAVGVVAPMPVLDCISQSLRACLAPGKGFKLYGFDFSQIEARVLAWLAGQQDILSVFRRGEEDVYVWAAAQFGSTDRQLGKVLVLALGFGMGAIKLRETAQTQYGVKLSAGQSEKFKTGWRERNDRIVQFWYDMEGAAKTAVAHRGSVHAVGGSGVAFECSARTLQMRLPSGRVLYYHKPRIEVDGSLRYSGTEAGGGWGMQTTWGGKLAENATQAAARDVMAEAMLRISDRLGRTPVMTVHDELVYLLAEPAADVPEAIEDLMLEAPTWAGGLPIAGEGKLMSRYGVSA